jgi:hypothetical protein
VKKSTKYQILATKDRETSWKEIEVQRINIWAKASKHSWHTESLFYSILKNWNYMTIFQENKNLKYEFGEKKNDWKVEKEKVC